MRFLVMLFALLAASNWAGASTIPLIPPPNVVLTGSGYVTTGAITLSDVVTATEMRAAVGAGTATIAATMTVGEGAAAVALAALRATPAIATATTIAYLAQIGIQKCLDGTWCKRKSPAADSSADGYIYMCNVGSTSGDSPIAACAKAAAAFGNGYSVVGVAGDCGLPRVCLRVLTPYGPDQWAATRTGGCATGYSNSSGACVPSSDAPATEPATDADWNKGLTYPLPYGAANDLSAAKVPIPVNITPSSTPVTVMLSDPYVDPVTGKRYRDIAVVTPNSDGKTATLTTAKQEVDANGNPVTDPTTGGGKPPEKQDDPCSGHETRMGCVEQGDVPDGPDLKEKTVNVAITPDGGWGQDTMSCPADGVYSYLGKPITVSWRPACQASDMLRPVILGVAWIGAALILLGARKGDD